MQQRITRKLVDQAVTILSSRMLAAHKTEDEYIAEIASFLWVNEILLKQRLKKNKKAR